MPTVTSRPRIRRILLDLEDPYHYGIRAAREVVQEDETDVIVARRAARPVVREITFSADGTPEGDPRLLALLGPIQLLMESLVAEDEAAEQLRLKEIADAEADRQAQADAKAAQAEADAKTPQT